MNMSGWIFMIASWAGIILLMIYSYAKMLTCEPGKTKEKK